jgi:hypothetical protein
MVQLCSDEGSMDMIMARVCLVEKECAQWNVTSSQRKELYETVAKALDKINDSR